MKRLLAGLTTLAIIIALGVTGMVFTDNFVENISNILDSANNQIYHGEFKTAEELCHRAMADFKRKEALFSLFLNHGLIEELEMGLSELPDLATKETENFFLSKLDKTKTVLLELKKSQKHIF